MSPQRVSDVETSRQPWSPCPSVCGMGKALGGARIAPTVAGVTLAAITLALALSGCVSADPAVTPQPQASATPLFASDAEALKAAEEAYAAYLKVSDQILADGGANPERIEGVATSEQLVEDRLGFEKARANSQHSLGVTTFDRSVLQVYAPNASRGHDIVAIYLCEDVSKVDVFDSTGASVVSATRPNRAGYEVRFDAGAPPARPLLVSNKTSWTVDSCI